MTFNLKKVASSNRLAERLEELFGKDGFRAALILVAVLAIFYRDVFFAGRTFLMENSVPGVMPFSQGGGPYGYPRQSNELAPSPVKDAGAIAWGYEASMKLARDLIRQGQLPLWKANQGLGSPLLADGMSVPMEPLLFLTYFLPGKWWPWVTDALVLLRFFLAGWFTYLLARQIGAGFWASVFGGSAFMLSYQVVVFGDNPQLPSLILMPLLLYSFDRLAHNPSFRTSAGTALVIAWVICAGLPEASFLVLLMGGLWFLYRAFWKLKEADFTLPAFHSRFGWSVAAVLSGIAFSAWFWLPLVENISNSVTNHPVGRGLMTLRLRRFILAILPPIEPMTFFPTFGIVVMTLAIVAVIALRRLGKKTNPGVFFLGYFLIFGLELYGVPPFRWIGYLPGYSQINIPHYMVPSLTLSAIMLATLGLDYLIEGSRRLWSLLLSCILQMGVIGYFVGLNHIPFEYPQHTMRLNLAVTFAVFLSMCVIVLALRTIGKKVYIPVFFLLLLLAEVMFIHRHTIRPVRYDPFTEAPFISFLKAQAEPFRITAFDGILYPDIAMAFGIDDLRYLDAIEPLRRHLFMQALIAPQKSVDRITGTESPFIMGRMMDFLNIRYVLAPSDIELNDKTKLSDHYNLVYNHEIQIYENKGALPRAFLLYRAEQADDLNAALNRLADPSFDIFSTAVVEKSQWLPQLQDLSNSLTSEWKAAKVVDFTANSIEMQTDSPSPGILVVSENYFPGWRGYIDGQIAKIFPVDGMLRGVYVPAGRHQINMVYRPLSFITGIVISVIVLLAWIAAVFLFKRQKNSIY